MIGIKLIEYTHLLNITMRAYELYMADHKSLGIYDPGHDRSKPGVTDNGKPVITLRHLNKLKQIRKRNQKAQYEKMALLSQMYSGERLADEVKLKGDISDEIDNSEIDAKQKLHIETMAMNAVKRQRKT